MGRRDRSWFSRIWEAKSNPLVFIFLTWAFAISTNYWSEYLGPIGTLGFDLWPGWTRAGFMLISPALFGLALYAILPKGRTPAPTSRIRPAPKRKGVVVLQSQRGGPAWDAIAHHFGTCQRVWVIHSEESLPDAEALRARLESERRLPREAVTLIALRNGKFEDPEEVKDRIEAEVFDKLPDGFEEDDVAIDITGGTKPTTAGAFLAGLPPGRRLQLTSAIRDPETGLVVKAGEVREIQLDYDIRRRASE